MADAALGFLTHTGWAAMVALGGSPREPRVIDRRRIELVEPGTPANVFHVAREELGDGGPEFVRHATEAVQAAATKSLAGAVEHLTAAHDLVGAGVVLGGTVGDIPLTKQIASHPLNHAAEGELYRDAIIGACTANGLPVAGFPKDQLDQLALESLALTPDRLETTLTQLGKGIGPPWRKDHKHAALVAWFALRAAS